MKKTLILGLDTGGTHTDAVVYDAQTHSILATAKDLTTHHDLAIGVCGALKNLQKVKWEGGLEDVALVNISTTLATNTVAEGLGSRVGLVLIGYDQNHKVVTDLTENLPRVETVFVDGGHDFYGRQVAPLDEEKLLAEVKKLDETVEAWAVSSFFSVKNSSHEIAAENIIKAVSKSPVTLGRTLTGEINAVRRAATAALNAGLVGVINRLLNAVKKTIDDMGMKARLMVVKGDGSLVSEAWARERPIETVVSGPAAGLVGARTLTRGFLEPEEKNLWVMDVGGTTTDLAFIYNGLPKVNANGAKVGAWDTMTTAVETRTRGLGGDSLVTVDKFGEITIGPRRVLPLCRLGEKYPTIIQHMNYYKNVKRSNEMATYFFLPGAPEGPGMSDAERDIVAAMKKNVPYPMAQHAEFCLKNKHHFGGVAQLTHPSVMISAFTPTDALAFLGLFNCGSLKAAQVAATVMCRYLDMDEETFCRKVLDEFGKLLTEEILTHGLSGNDLDYELSDLGPTGLLGEALKRRPKRTPDIEISYKIKDPVVFLGAPAAVLEPFLGRHLNGRLIVPPSFDVASAAGAAAAPIYLTRKVEIHSLPNLNGYRLFLPDRMVDGFTVEELVIEANTVMTAHMKELANMAGAESMTLEIDRKNHRVTWVEGNNLFLGATLTYTLQGQAA